MSVWFVGVFALLSVLALAGCGGSSSSGAGGGGEASAEQRYLRRQLTRMLDEIEAGIEANPLNYEFFAADARRARTRAERLGFGDLAQRAEQLAEKARTAFERGKAQAVDDAIAAARRLVEQGRYNDAYHLLDLPDQALDDPERARKVAAVRREIKLAARAKDVYETVIDQKLYSMEIAGQYERARGLLESFFLIEPFRKSPVAKEVRSSLASIEPKAREQAKARAAEKNAKWIPAFYGREDGKDLGEWRWSDDLVTGPQVSGGIATLAHTGERKRTYMLYGGRDWQDYIVDVEFALEKGEVWFDFRGEPEGDDESAPLRWVPGKGIDEDDVSLGEFVSARFEVRGEGVTWQIADKDGVSTGGKALATRRGPFQIRVEDGSVVKIKSVFVKVLRRAKATGADGDEGEQQGEGS